MDKCKSFKVTKGITCKAAKGNMTEVTFTKEALNHFKPEDEETRKMMKQANEYMKKK